MRRVNFIIIFVVLMQMGINTDIGAQCYELVWSDEFDYTGLPDATRWGYDVGGGGWGNNELQYYTDERLQNAEVKDGKLVITAIKESYKGTQYTSARLVTKNKGDWKYGRFEIKAKLPRGKGIWPAIWMLPTDWEYGGWPESGETDIMEYVGYEPDVVHGTVHTGSFNGKDGTQKGSSITLETAEEDFHVYAIEWTEDKIDFIVDSFTYFTYENLDEYTYMEWPYDKRFHLLLNIAVGGDWGGAHGIDESIFPQQMEVDYVRVYSNPDFNKIKGKQEVNKNESNLEYYIYPAEGVTYNWTIPNGVSVVGVSDSNSITVNWGCEPEEIACEVQADCGDTNLVFPVKIKSTTITGDFFFENNDTGKVFSVSETGASGITWKVPEDAEIISGQGTTKISVNWGVTPGNVSVIQENSCGTDTALFYVFGDGQFPYPNPNIPHALPGEINPVEYDYGGEGVAFHDTETENQGAGIRQDEAVDTQITDNGNDNIGWVISGEWLEYSISVKETGEYYFSVRTSSDNSSTRGPLSISVNGETRVNIKSVPYSGSWTSFDWLPSEKISLFDTDTLLRVNVGSGNFNIGKIKIEKEDFVPVNVENKTQSPFIVYPNPSASYLTIYCEKKYFMVNVYNLMGKLEMAIANDQMNSEFRLNTAHLNSGIYYLQLLMDSGNFEQKMFVKN